MKVQLNRIDNEYLFEAKGSSGVPVMIDNKTRDEVKGASPMELLLMGVGGCSAIDIISILKKQKLEIDSYKVEVEGDRVEVGGAKPFNAMRVEVFLEGDIPPEKALRAAKLSFEKYCSVSITLQKGVEVTYQVHLNGEILG
ncbi:MAG: OsmC family protein [Leeuwenhoekiella sp.]